MYVHPAEATLMKKRKKKPEINWHRIEQIQLKGFRGQQLTGEEMDLIQLAIKHYPREYGIRGAKVRANEVARIRGGGVP